MERFVRLLGHAARRAPRVVIAVALLLTVVFGVLSSRQELDSGNEAFSPDNAELRALNFAQQTFGQGAETVVQVVVRGDDVISAAGFETAAAVRRTVGSALPDRYLAQQPDRSAVVTWLDPLFRGSQREGAAPADEAAFDRRYQQALQAAPSERRGQLAALVASDGDAPKTDADAALALVILDRAPIVADAPDTSPDDAVIDVEEQLADAIAAMDAPLEATAFSFGLLQRPDETFNQEVSRLFGIAAAVIVLILLSVYLVRPRGRLTRLGGLRRAATDTGLTLIAILASITWMQGLGVLLGPDYLGIIGPFTPPTQIIPILLIGLGVDYAIHMTSRYREEVAEGLTPDRAAQRATVTVGVALVLATLATAVGFLTNVTNPVPAIQDFGVLAAVGISVAFLLTLTFVPAVRLLLDRRADRAGRLPREALASSQDRFLPRMMANASTIAEVAPVNVLAITLVLAGIGTFGLTRLDTEFSFADFLPDGSELKEAFTTVEEEFGGGFAETSSIVVRGDVATPAVHNAMVETQRRLTDVPGVVTFDGRVAAQSPVSTLAALIMPGDQGPADPEGRQRFLAFAREHGLREDLTFASDGDVAAVYQRLLELSPQARSVLATSDGELTATLVDLQTQSADVGADVLRRGLQDAAAPLSQAPDVEAVVTSDAIVAEVIVDALSSSQVSSLLITLGAALALLVVTFWVRERRPALGALTLAPVGLVVLWVFGAMAATGIPFGPVTAMISALAIGIGVPFTIHVAHRFIEDVSHEADLDTALRVTLRNTGGALAGSAFTTMAGFAVLISSSLPPFRQLGTVIAYAIGFALIAATLVLPSMLALWYRWHRRRGEPPEPVDVERDRALVDAGT